MQITDEELQQLRALRMRRETAAYMIGVATEEWRRRIARQEQIIQGSEMTESELGPQILRAHGIDPATAEYRIESQTGRVLRLAQVSGEAHWIDHETGEVVDHSGDMRLG